MRIEFDVNGGATFIMFKDEKEVARETIPWIEVLRVGNELTSRARIFVEQGVRVGEVGVIGRATVSDPPAKPHDAP